MLTAMHHVRNIPSARAMLRPYENNKTIQDRFSIDDLRDNRDMTRLRGD